MTHVDVSKNKSFLQMNKKERDREGHTQRESNLAQVEM